MAKNSTPKRRKDFQVTCSSIRFSLLEDGSIAVTFIPIQKKGAQKEKERSMVLHDKHVRGLRSVLNTYADEVPNKDLIASIEAAEKYMKSRKRQWYDNVDDLMQSLR